MVCVSKPGELIYQSPGKGVTDYYDNCRQGAIASILTGTQYIILCPSFFSMTAAPTKATCPYVNRWTDNFNDRDKGKSLVNFQIFALMHEIAHFYIYATIRSRVDIYEINNCVKLGAQYARGNPRSYDYYAGMINSKCASFPRDANGRELLSVEDPLLSNMTVSSPSLVNSDTAIAWASNTTTFESVSPSSNQTV